MNRKLIGFCSISVMLHGCASAAPAEPAEPVAAMQQQRGERRYGPEQRFRGRWATAFEQSLFEGCWLTFASEVTYTPEALSGLEQNSGSGPMEFQLDIIGRRTLGPPRRPGDGYGHMGMAQCEIRATRLISARRIQ